jgi:Alkylmercury lyase
VGIEDLRLAVYGRFRRGEIPRIADLPTELSTTPEQVGTGLATLAAGRHVALGPDGEIAKAHPFTAVPLGFSVMGRDTLWWGRCAWDSFALPHLLPDQGLMLVATTCPACEQAHAWRVDDQEPPVGDQVAHFGSFWPPSYRASYDLRWMVEDGAIVGLRFTELGRGSQFDGRYRD